MRLVGPYDIVGQHFGVFYEYGDIHADHFRTQIEYEAIVDAASWDRRRGGNRHLMSEHRRVDFCHEERSSHFRESRCGVQEEEVEYYTQAFVILPSSSRLPIEVSDILIGRAYEIIRCEHLLRKAFPTALSVGWQVGFEAIPFNF